jgi:hypothetical protein
MLILDSGVTSSGTRCNKNVRPVPLYSVSRFLQLASTRNVVIKENGFVDKFENGYGMLHWSEFKGKESKKYLLKGTLPYGERKKVCFPYTFSVILFSFSSTVQFRP